MLRLAAAALLLAASAAAAAAQNATPAPRNPHPTPHHSPPHRAPSPRPSGVHAMHRSNYGNGGGTAYNRPYVILDAATVKQVLASPSPRPTRAPNTLENNDPDVFGSYGTNN
jgi:hypothetical protein